jgi:hypothetical protein
VTDGGGNQTLTSANGTALLVSNVDNLTVDSIDLSWTGDDILRGTGFNSQNNSDTVLLQNLIVNNRSAGVYVNTGSDVQILNNDLRNNGSSVSAPSLEISNIGGCSPWVNTSSRFVWEQPAM